MVIFYSKIVAYGGIPSRDLCESTIWKGFLNYYKKHHTKLVPVIILLWDKTYCTLLRIRDYENIVFPPHTRFSVYVISEPKYCTFSQWSWESWGLQETVLHLKVHVTQGPTGVIIWSLDKFFFFLHYTALSALASSADVPCTADLYVDCSPYCIDLLRIPSLLSPFVGQAEHLFWLPAFLKLPLYPMGVLAVIFLIKMKSTTLLSLQGLLKLRERVAGATPKWLPYGEWLITKCLSSG